MDAEPQRTRAATASTTTPPRSITKGTQQPVSPRSPPPSPLHIATLASNGGSGGASSPRGTRRARANTLTPMRTPPPMSPLPHDAIYDSIHLYTVRSQRGGLRERSRLNKTISKLARNELTRRTSVSLKAAIRPNREGHIFDYFCVVGYPPAAKVEIKASAQARRQEPVILYQYPEDNQLNEQVVHFCFPNGVTPTVSLRKKTADQKTATLELANCTMKELKDSERSFLFLMTGNGALLYGICVSQNELLSCLEKPSFFKQPAYNPPSPLSPTELRYEVSAPRVYCLLSRFPFFKLHFNVLYTLLETERTMQREARERARMQSGMASKTEQASTAAATRANSISSEVEATKDIDRERDKDKDKEDEREKKGGAWNWRWRWGKDKDKKDSKDGSNKDTSKDPAPKMARTSSANSLSNWTVKKTIKDDISATRAESSTSITTALISPRRGRANSRGAPEKPDTTLSSTKDEGETTPRGRSATTKNESEHTSPARKRSNSRVRSLFALGANKIERGEIVSTIGDESGNAQPQAAEAEEASPFPGIRLHQNHEAEEATGPFPGIRLRMCKEAASEDQAIHSNAVAGAADAELGDTVTTPGAGARRRADTTDDQPDSSKEKNKVVALLEAYYNTNIRSTLGSFTVKLPSAKRHGKFVCPEGDEEKLIMEWCAPTMLRLLPLPNIIMLMRALLQEYKIVLLCKNLGVLSFIAMALLPLLRPFEWQGPFIPLVPKNLEECVESPVPCVLGMPTTCEEDLIPVVMDDCLIVNIETEQVVLPERPLAPLPNEEDFYAQLGVYHSKIYRPVNSPDRDTAFHRPAKSTDEEQAVAAGFLSLVRSYQERLVQEIVNYAHIHCISESSPAPSLPSLPLSASPSLSAPCMPSVTSPSVASAAFAGSVTTSFSPLASSASYSSLTTFEQAELEETLSHAYTDRHHYAGAAAAMNYVRPPPLSPGGASPQRRHFQLPPAVHSYSLALPTIRELDSDDDSGGGGAKSDDEGRLESTSFNLASSPSGAKKDPTKRRLLMDDHEQWARTRSDNSDEVVSAKVALGCSDVVDLSSSAGGKGHKTKQGGKTKGKSGRRKGHGEGGFAATSALIQTLPHNRELEDIKAQVEIDRVSSDDIKGAQEMKAKTKSEKNESDSESDEEGESSSTTASLRTHPMRTSKNLSFSASSIPAFVESTSPDPNPPAPINLAQFIDGQTGGAKNESEGSGRRKVVAIPTLPIRMRGATPLSTSDQPMQPGSSSPTHSPPSSPKFGGSGSASGSDHSDTNADGAPQLILSLRPSVPPLSSHLPQLAASSFDWTDMNSLKKLVCLFPVTQQKFIANFLFTQHFTMFTERLAKIFGEKRSRKSNVITPRSAARFLDQLKKMIDQEEGQATMARSLLQIYTMLEEQKEVVGGGASDETIGDHQHHQVHAVGSPPVDHHSLAVPHSQPSQQPNRKSVLGISLASSSDFGMGKVKDAIKHSGSSIGVRGEVAAPPSGHSGHSSSSLSVSPAASVASPVGAVKRPGHRRQGSVGGQEILKIKPEEEIEGEVGKEQKNMEQIIKLSDERLRILTRSKDTLKALFNSDSPTSSQQSSPLTFVASGGGEATSSSPSSLSSTTVSPSAVTIPSPRSANGASLIPAKPATSSSPSPSSSLATSTSTKALLSPRRQQGGPQINIVVTGDSDRDSVESEDSLQEAEDRRKGNKKIRGRAGARRASLGGGDDPQQQLSPRSRGPEVETDSQRRLRSPSDSP